MCSNLNNENIDVIPTLDQTAQLCTINMQMQPQVNQAKPLANYLKTTYSSLKLWYQQDLINIFLPEYADKPYNHFKKKP